LDQREWIRSLLLIAVLLALVIILAQSRRECEIPGSDRVIEGPASDSPTVAIVF